MDGAVSPGDQAKLGVRDAADRAGVSVKTIRRAIERGDLMAYRPRGQRTIRILVEDLDAWALEPAFPAARKQRLPSPPAAAGRSRHSERTGSVTRLRAIERGEG